MTLTSILVHVDNTERGERNLDAAIELASDHDAHLIGLGVKPPMSMPGYAAVQVPQEVYDMFAEEQERTLAEARKLFDDKIRAAGREARSAWRQSSGEVAMAISIEGRGADLVVIGQEDIENDPVYYEGVPDRVVLDAGRPVLVIPYVGFRSPIGKRVLVAWNDSREAARALADALPFLKAADEVEVISVAGPDGEDVPGADVGRYLSEHGIEANVSRSAADDIGPEDILLNRAADDAADLIVMGAYGHSRLRELVLGGVTRHVLKHMTAPVLMSH